MNAKQHSNGVCYLFICRKARRKEREGDGSQGDPKLYLEGTLLERKLPELDMRQVVEIPEGIDYNEWLASHSEYFLFI